MGLKEVLEKSIAWGKEIQNNGEDVVLEEVNRRIFKMIFLNMVIQSKSSIEESNNLSTNVPFSGFLMSEDALVGW